MDIIDRAQEVEAMHRARALADATRPVVVGPERTACLSCGEDIPEARRRAVPGCARCADCQVEVER